MTLAQWFKQKMLRFLGIEHLSNDPNDGRQTFINNDDEILKTEQLENKVWYVGNSSELLNFYTGKTVFGFWQNILYNRNELNYYWSLSSEEAHIKRVHCGIPRAIIDSMVNAIGYPAIEISRGAAISTDAIEKADKMSEKLQKILDYNKFKNIYNQQQMPLTLTIGDGCYKIIIDKDFCEYPIIQFYEGQDIEFIEEYGLIVGVMFKDYYKYNDKDYVKIETRRVAKVDGVPCSYIEHDLFKLGKNNQLSKVELGEVPELANLETLVIKGLDKPLCVPCRFFYNPIYKNRGRSVFEGKKDLFDLLDEIWSQLSATNRVSTPVEYYNTDILEKNKQGVPILPNRYDRQYVQKSGVPDGDGLTGGKDIETTQPQLNYEQYISAFKSTLDAILTGFMSPATLGIDVAKKDNADAQREKEKITLMTRDNVIESEVDILRQLCQLLLISKEFIDSGEITLQEYDVSVKYKTFANPSFEHRLQYLTSALTSGSISVEKFVDLLWTDEITKDEKEDEIEYIKEHQEKDQFNLGGMFNDETGTTTPGTDTDNTETEPDDNTAE